MLNDGIIKRCAFGAMIALMLILASATLIEKVYGSEFVLERIYASPWMVVTWGILVASSVTYILSRKLYRQKAVFLLHCAFLLILAGAFTTHLTGKTGLMHIRQGETERSYLSEKEMSEQSLPFDVKLILFDIEYHPGTDEPSDFISFLKVDGEICRVSMNKIHSHKGYRFYQTSFDPDEMGTLLTINRDPWGIGITYAGYLLLGVVMLWLLWSRLGWKGSVCTFIPVAALWFYISRLNPMTPVLRSPMLAAHVSVIMISYALLIVISITGIAALCSKRLCDKFYKWNSTLLYPALFLLAAGIFIGAVWANISWGRYWGWDAKETWALIAMLVYALPMHKTSFKLFRNPKWFHIYCISASLTIAMTFFGVTYFLGGIHSYV